MTTQVECSHSGLLTARGVTESGPTSLPSYLPSRPGPRPSQHIPTQPYYYDDNEPSSSSTAPLSFQSDRSPSNSRICVQVSGASGDWSPSRSRVPYSNTAPNSGEWPRPGVVDTALPKSSPASLSSEIRDRSPPHRSPPRSRILSNNAPSSGDWSRQGVVDTTVQRSLLPPLEYHESSNIPSSSTAPNSGNWSRPGVVDTTVHRSLPTPLEYDESSKIPFSSTAPSSGNWSRSGATAVATSEVTDWSPSAVPKSSPASLVTREKSPLTNKKAFHTGGSCSAASVDNARYRLNQSPMSDHDNEDRFFTIDQGGYQVFGVFDGHDGARAVDFAVKRMTEFFGMPSWLSVVNSGKSELVATVLDEYFKTTEKEFFEFISEDVGYREALSACIPRGLNSYQAQLQYPDEVAQLQVIESNITGGCTAVVAVIANRTLCVANVGDSRAILIRERPSDRTLYAQQLSEDHGVENEKELTRLEALGLSKEKLRKAGRLGMQENTRSIGDYYIKRGYRDVDTLEHARGPPGIATPHVATPVPIDDTFRYLVLMTDGVYKSIEGMFTEKNAIEANKVLTGMIHGADQPGSDPTNLANAVVSRITQRHEATYREAARKDPRSPLAVSCRKRDDTTCVIYKFPPKAAPRPRRLSQTKPPFSAPSSLQDMN